MPGFLPCSGRRVGAGRGKGALDTWDLSQLWGWGVRAEDPGIQAHLGQELGEVLIDDAEGLPADGKVVADIGGGEGVSGLASTCLKSWGCKGWK